MTDSEKSLFERLKPLWEAAEKLGEVDPEFDSKAFMDEIWEVDHEESIALWAARNSQEISDRELAEDFDTQFKMIAAAYATGDVDEIDRIINHISFIRRMMKQGVYDLADPNDEEPCG